MRKETNRLLAMIALAAALALAGTNAVAGPEDGRRKDQAHHDQHHAEMQKQAQQKAEKKAKAQQAMGDKDIAGHRMLTAEERKRFTEQMQAAENDRERERIREEHRELIKARTEAEKNRPEKDSG